MPTALTASPNNKPQQLFQCSKCLCSICEGCWLKSWADKHYKTNQLQNELLAQCARCLKRICFKCKPSFMADYETILPGCFACPKSFCEGFYHISLLPYFTVEVFVLVPIKRPSLLEAIFTIFPARSPIPPFHYVLRLRQSKYHRLPEKRLHMWYDILKNYFQT